MSQNRNKSITHWTYKHDEYCLENSITPSAKLLWQWLVKKGYFQEEIIDLKEFNKWVSKHRIQGAYCNKSVKNAFNKLVECRVVNCVKDFTWNLVKIVTRSLEYLKPRRKVQKRDIFSNLDAVNAYCAEQVLYQQQHINIINNQILFSEYGIHFNEYETEVLDRPKHEILLSIVCYQIKDSKRNSNQTDKDGYVLHTRANKIDNPEGWIKSCLRRRYWDEQRTREQIELKYWNSQFIYELYPNLIADLSPIEKEQYWHYLKRRKHPLAHESGNGCVPREPGKSKQQIAFEHAWTFN